MRSSQILLLLAPFVAALMTSCTTMPGGYDVAARRPQNPNNVKVKVSLRNQAVYVKEGDDTLMAAATCVGTPAKPTPKGNFRVFRKIAQKRSGSYGFWVKGDDIRGGTSGERPGSGYRYVGYPMPYWVEFSSAYGFHEGYVWPQPRTHGCLRLHKNAAGKFYELVKIGTPVHIAATQPEDDTEGANLRRPTDYKDPDPPAPYMVSQRVFDRPPAQLN
jgi:L,D-transpeptidase catalytic domain